MVHRLHLPLQRDTRASPLPIEVRNGSAACDRSRRWHPSDSPRSRRRRLAGSAWTSRYRTNERCVAPFWTSKFVIPNSLGAANCRVTTRSWGAAGTLSVLPLAVHAHGVKPVAVRHAVGQRLIGERGPIDTAGRCPRADTGQLCRCASVHRDVDIEDPQSAIPRVGASDNEAESGPCRCRPTAPTYPELSRQAHTCSPPPATISAPGFRRNPSPPR